MRTRLVPAVLIALLLVVAACGDDDDTVDTTAPPADEVTTTEAPAPDETEPETTDPAPDPATAADPEQAVGWFMDARVEGSGAEAFLTEFAADVFPDEIALYDVASYEIGAVEAADANSFEVTVDVTDDEGDTRTETLFVGPGESADGEQLPYAVRGGVVG
jgi:hypothetical protein